MRYTSLLGAYDIFKTIIPLTSVVTIKVGGNALETQRDTWNSKDTIFHQVERFIVNNNLITRVEIIQKLNVSVRSDKENSVMLVK